MTAVEKFHKSLRQAALLAILAAGAFSGVASARGAALLPLNGSAAADKIVFHVGAGALIAAEGDSLTYGADFTAMPDGSVRERSPTPYPASLARDLGDRVRVENRGWNGDRSIDGLKRWARAAPGDVTFIMYGTNDYGNFGHHPGGGVAVDAYRAAMEALIARRQQAHDVVVVLLPPPLSWADGELGMQAYRRAAIEAANDRRAYVFDTRLPLASFAWPWSDGLHLKAEAYQAIAAALAAHIAVEDR